MRAFPRGLAPLCMLTGSWWPPVEHLQRPHSCPASSAGESEHRPGTAAPVRREHRPPCAPLTAAPPCSRAKGLSQLNGCASQERQRQRRRPRSSSAGLGRRRSLGRRRLGRRLQRRELLLAPQQLRHSCLHLLAAVGQALILLEAPAGGAGGGWHACRRRARQRARASTASRMHRPKPCTLATQPIPSPAQPGPHAHLTSAPCSTTAASAAARASAVGGSAAAAAAASSAPSPPCHATGGGAGEREREARCRTSSACRRQQQRCGHTAPTVQQAAALGGTRAAQERSGPRPPAGRAPSRSHAQGGRRRRRGQRCGHGDRAQAHGKRGGGPLAFLPSS